MPSSQLTAVLESLMRGAQPGEPELTVLSALDAAGIDQVSAAWPSIPASNRQLILDLGTAMASESIALEFEAVALVALDDEDPVVRCCAIAALWDDASPRTAARIARVLRDDESDQVRARAAEALGQCALAVEFGTIDGSSAEEVLDALRGAATDAAEPVDVRAWAVESAGYRSLPWVDTLITDAYYSDDRLLHLAGIRAMGHSASEKWIDYLQEELASDDAEVRKYAAEALGEISSELAVDALGEALTDPDSEVQAAVIVALSDIAGEEAIRYLAEFAEEAPEEHRLLVARAIDSASGAGADPEDLFQL